MKYKELHKKYKTNKVEGAVVYCKGLGKDEIPGSDIHQAGLGDFLKDYVTHLQMSLRDRDHYVTTETMTALLNANVTKDGSGNLIVKWVGPWNPSFCK